jgi:hypothetical protein
VGGLEDGGSGIDRAAGNNAHLGVGFGVVGRLAEPPRRVRRRLSAARRRRRTHGTRSLDELLKKNDGL